MIQSLLGKKKKKNRSDTKSPKSSKGKHSRNKSIDPASAAAAAADDASNAAGADDLEARSFVEKTKLSDITKYEAIILEDDETSKQRANQATDEDVAREIDLMLGPTKEWSSESEECIAFRKHISRARTMRNVGDIDQKDLLPPVYLSDDPLPESDLNKTLICKIHLTSMDMKKSVPLDPLATAEDFSEMFLKKMNVAHNFNRNKDEWIFKATGTAEYLYGHHKMIEFEHIRRCMKKGVQVELSLMDRDEVVAELDPHDLALKSISYDIEYSAEEEERAELDHDLIKFNPAEWHRTDRLSMWDLKQPFRVKIRGIDSIQPTPEFRKEMNPAESVIYVLAELAHGGTVLTQPRVTRAVPFMKEPRFDQYIYFDDLLMCDIPRETRICLTVYARPFKPNDPMLTARNNEGQVAPKDFPVGHVCTPLIDFKNMLKSGCNKLRMWPNEKAKLTTSCMENIGSTDNPMAITFELDTFAYPVVFPTGKPPSAMRTRFDEFELEQNSRYGELSEEDLKKELTRILHQDPLYVLNDEEKWRIWQNRELLKCNPNALSKFLLSVPWRYPTAVHDAHEMLYEWERPSPIDAIELLDYNFGSTEVRQYAVARLDALSNSELSDLILQLVQTLKYELFHDTALARFLLQHGLRSTHHIGHILFWHLKAEMHVPTIRERYGLILEEYLRYCGGHRRELLKQNGVIEQLLAIAIKVKQVKGPRRREDQLRVLHEELRHNFKHPPKFKLPLSPRMEVKGIIVEKCKVMSSKKLPLWLAFENADETGGPILTMFKAGDDLRQDLLTLQMLKFCDKLWKAEGLDLHMQPYGCICTGDEIGMIEIVTNSDTIANITAAKGGASAAFSNTPLIDWLKKNNPKKEDLESAIQNFILSTAGYCTATHVLGIGDRHNDNIMLSRRGDLFHIDFGHFLGHFKVFKGIYKRETTPFVFTPMYAGVLGGPDSANFRKFVELGAQAFNILRKNGHVIISLFLLMLATGIPELRGVEDVEWLRKCLVLDKTDEEAAKHWAELVRVSLSNTRARINDAVHIIAHRK